MKDAQSLLETLTWTGDEELSAEQTYGLYFPEQMITEKGPSYISELLSLRSLSIEHLPQLSIAEDAEESSGSPLFKGVHDLSFQEMLGKGGLGEVYLARQHSLQREVAIKRLQEEFVLEGNKLSLLMREGVIMGFLEHPNIVPVHLLGRDEKGRPLLIMKRIEGVSWLTLMQDEEHPVWETLRSEQEDMLQCHLHILSEVCRAVEFAHSKGIIHCDIKPENVMIGEFGEVYLLDWGIAQLATARSSEPPSSTEKKQRLLGTPAYMAPEMTVGEFTEQSDVYLLGSTLHEILTKTTRHTGPTLIKVLYSVVASEPYLYPPSVPKDLADLCNQATHLHQEMRPASVRDFRLALAKHKSMRFSYALAEEAQLRLEALRAALASESEADSSDIHRIFTECRFGYLQALRERQDNPLAKEGLQGCLEVMLDYHLREQNLSSAQALLSELPQPNEALAQRVEVLAQSIMQKRSKEEAYERMLREQDTEISQDERSLVIAILFVSAVVVPIVLKALFGWKASSFELDTSTLGSLSAGVGLTLLILRKSLFRNHVNRVFVFCIVLGVSSMWAVRSLMYFENIARFTSQKVELLLLACVVAAFAIFRRYYLYCALIFFSGFLASSVWPEGFQYIVGSCMAGAGWVYYRYFGTVEDAPQVEDTSK